MEFITSQPRGLHNFIAEIRDAKSKEDERSRVDKELGNIRQKFTSSSTLNSYQKKKYVWKLCYIYMLGYEVDFGHMEFISLLSSTKFQEKSVGYMAVALFLKPGDEMMTLVINSIRNDIVGHLNFGKTLALSAISNIGGTDLAEALSADVQRLIVSPLEEGPSYHMGPGYEQELQNKANVCKKASLCLLRLFRTNPDCVTLTDWVQRLVKLLEDRDIGVVTSVMSLLLGLTSHSPDILYPLIPYVISNLTRLVINRTCPSDYMYYRTPSPWLQVKSLRFLQYYEAPDKTQRDLLFEVLNHILTRTEVSDSVNKSNADHSILFEAVTLVIHYGNDVTPQLRDSTIALLGRFISVKEANIRYLGLDAMNRLVKLEGPNAVKVHQSTVLDSLKDVDISVRRRALGLLFSLTDGENVHFIVSELLVNLSSAESAMKDEMVVKIAILAEKFNAGNMQWYVDIMVKVIIMAGDYVAEAVWHRIVLLVVNHSEVHEYAAEKMLEIVQSKWAHDTAVALAGYLLGEIGVNICEKVGMSGYDQFAALHQHFMLSSLKTQALLLTSYVKLFNLYPDTRKVIIGVFEKHSVSSQLEIQQRSCEYLKLSELRPDMIEQVLNMMPPFAEGRENSLLALIAVKEDATSDRPAWAVKADQGNDDIANGFAASEKADFRASGMTLNRPSRHAVTSDLLSIDDEPQQDILSPSLLRTDESSSFSESSGDNDPRQSKSLKMWFNAACIAPAGQKCTLYEDNSFLITIQSDYRGQHGRLSLFLLNKTTSPFRDVSIVIPEVNYLLVKVLPMADTLPGGDEARLQIAVECKRPFSEFPTVLVSFTSSGAGHKQTLQLPLTVASFFEPVTTDKITYLSRWQSLGNEVQEVFSSAKPIDNILLAFLRNTLIHGLKIGLAEGLDITDKTITGSASLRTGTAGSDGNLVSVGVMFRLEADCSQNRFRITVRSKHASLSSGLKNVFQRQFE